MNAELIFAVLVVGVLFGLVGLIVGRMKGNGAMGFWLGFLLGPLGLIVAVLLPENPAKTRMKCKRCGAAHDGHSRTCKGCGAMMKKKPHVPQLVDPVDQWEARQRAGK